jgi:hypothetical protein
MPFNRDPEVTLTSAQVTHAERTSPPLRDWALAQRVRTLELGSEESEAAAVVEQPSGSDTVENDTAELAFSTEGTLAMPLDEQSSESGDVESGLEFEVYALIKIPSQNGTDHFVGRLRLGGVSGTILAESISNWDPADNEYCSLHFKGRVSVAGASGILDGLGTAKATGEATQDTDVVLSAFDFAANPQPSITVTGDWNAAHADNVAELQYINVSVKRYHSVED